VDKILNYIREPLRQMCYMEDVRDELSCIIAELQDVLGDIAATPGTERIQIVVDICHHQLVACSYVIRETLEDNLTSTKE
jgi:hypothetical protein